MMGEKTISITFLGDISLNAKYNELYEKGEKPFEEIGNFLADSDLVVGNLECFAESKQGENLLKKPRLKTKLETLNYLKDINLGLACLANNHFYDNLEEGFKKTIDFLTNNNINYIGASMTGMEEIPFIFEKDGISVAILNYVTPDTNPHLPEDAKVKPNWFYLKKVEQDIRDLRNKVDYIIVYPHWGGKMEGALLPDKELIPIAHKIIDAGADIIIGHHSHTIQPYEIYQGKYIFYSLGNFCFSDIIFEGKISYLDRKRGFKGIIVKAMFAKKSHYIKPLMVSIADHNIIPLYNNLNPAKIDNNLLMNKFWELYVIFEKEIYPLVRYLFFSGQSPLVQILNIFSKQVYKFTNKNILRNYAKSKRTLL